MASAAARLLSHVVVLLLLLLLCCSPMATAKLPVAFESVNYDSELAFDIAEIAFQLYVARMQRRPLKNLPIIDAFVHYANVGLKVYRSFNRNTEDIRYYAEIWGHVTGGGLHTAGVHVAYTVRDYDSELTYGNKAVDLQSHSMLWKAVEQCASSITSTSSIGSSAPVPFILGKRLRTDDDPGALATGIGPVGFWAVPRRTELGQIWSYGAPETVFPPVGEGSLARLRSYLPPVQGHLNLLASLSGAPPAAIVDGRREEKPH
ncbi:Transcription factor TCP7 [Apostasia shenzhenica]|uniref:Transcription factor TCP7 n=1 Tax=Apostasia shenzhenica TaxID=1088818 RepID=A0A2H9ZY90_9ASPA|nr:Transcription factor TCP7 [Apostasia shenzhenica]